MKRRVKLIKVDSVIASSSDIGEETYGELFESVKIGTPVIVEDIKKKGFATITTPVERILEVNMDYVDFTTRNSTYRLEWLT